MKIAAVILPVSLFVLCHGLLIANAAAPGKKIIGPGDIMPDHAFRYTLPSQDREYLGIRQGFFSFLGAREFSIQNIPAEIIVVEFFNIYCTSCQAQAPVLNAVYKAITQNSALQEKVRFIGIGVGNNSREIEQFKKDKQVVFPLIPDTDFSFYNAVGDPGGTPFTVIAKRTSQGITVLSSNLGLIKDPDVFVQQIQEAAMPGAAGKPVIRESDLAAEEDDRMLELRMPEHERIEKIKQSLRSICPAEGSIPEPVKITLPSGETVYRTEIITGAKKTVLFTQIISRKPVCDVCHGVHFMVTFDRTGTLRAFTPIHITKYGNIPWKDNDVQFMASRIVGRSLKKELVFDPAADAVSSATMSSALIINSINSLRPVFDAISQNPE
jgi:thiol-disulfide isomerase/thioredoxin